MQLDAIKIIADQHAEIERLQRRIDELLDAANVAVEHRRAMKAQAIALCEAMELDREIPDAKTAAWNLKIGMLNL